MEGVKWRSSYEGHGSRSLGANILSNDSELSPKQLILKCCSLVVQSTICLSIDDCDDMAMAAHLALHCAVSDPSDAVMLSRQSSFDVKNISQAACPAMQHTRLAQL